MVRMKKSALIVGAFSLVTWLQPHFGVLVGIFGVMLSHEDYQEKEILARVMSWTGLLLAIYNGIGGHIILFIQYNYDLIKRFIETALESM